MFAKGADVTTIGNNPFIQAASTPTSGGANAARLAAQKAFFEAALGRQTTPAAPVQAAEPVAAPARQDFRASPQAMAEATPQRILRPGSLLNIVV